VPAFHGKVVAYPMKIPFVPDHDQRLAAVKRFFEPDVSAVERREIVQRYGVKYELCPKGHFEDWPQRLRAMQELGGSVYSSEDYELLRVDAAH
jgi:hypothetical protein